MKLSLFFIRQSSRGGLCLLLCAGLFSGCERNDVKVYHVAKEESPTPQPMPALPETPSSGMALPPPPSASLPQLNYQLPDGWQEKPPSEMRVASFTAVGANGQSGDVSVIPLPIVGHDLELVNMWRSQVQLPATSDPDAVKQAEPVAIGAEQGRLFDFISEQSSAGKSRQRILVAMLTSGGTSWFFKMTGEDDLVASQKPVFLQFLKSVRFVETATTPPAGAPAIQSDNGKSIWTVPPGWQEAPPSQFLFAKFVIADANGMAAVNISMMAGEGGGLLANANRWRGQLGLPPVTQEDEFSKMVGSMDVASGKAQVVDFAGTDSKSGKPARLIGVVVPQDGQTWFYKLMGDEPVVGQQKDAFTKFIQSANYANAR